MPNEKLTKEQKLEKAILDPEYRFQLLINGDPELNDVINAALVSAEFVFRAAADGAGLQKIIRTLHDHKANHQACHI
ncbi:MAG: hypothetical protein AB1480_03860 [Nitrospirota bacterium]